MTSLIHKTWTEWLDANSRRPPTLLLEKKNDKWSVEFEDSNSYAINLLTNGAVSDSEVLDYKITCDAASSPSPLHNYPNYNAAHTGQFICPGTILLA